MCVFVSSLFVRRFSFKNARRRVACLDENMTVQNKVGPKKKTKHSWAKTDHCRRETGTYKKKMTKQSVEAEKKLKDPLYLKAVFFLNLWCMWP